MDLDISQDCFQVNDLGYRWEPKCQINLMKQPKFPGLIMFFIHELGGKHWKYLLSSNIALNTGSMFFHIN